LKSATLINLSFLIPQPTGISTYALNILPYLKSLDPILLTSQTLLDYHCQLVPAGLTADKGTQGHFKRLCWTQLQLPKLYRDLEADLLFSPVTEAPLQSHCRYVVMCHDLIPLRFPNRFSPLTPYFHHYIPRVLKQAQHIICNSQATAQDIIDFYKIPAQKITPIPLAYDSSHFRFLDLPTQNYFLYLGRTIAYKNLQRLISAFAALNTVQDYQLWLAGPIDPRFLPVLQAQIAEFRLTAYVKFLDYVTYAELPALINHAIALVFPSLWEGFGLPVLEAMACGTPVITSNLSSLPEVAGGAALCIDPYDVQAIAQAMQAIITDASLWQQLRLAGLARARQFSWSKTGQATVEVLQSFLRC
jgi:glycosyltransferase involved in cell wall biosynthesis